MKLGIVCHAHFGGSGVIASELALALAERGHEVHVFSAGLPPRLANASHLTLHEVKTPTHPLFPHGDFTLALAAALSSAALDLIHVHYAIPLATSAQLAREIGTKAKLVTTVHGTDVLTLGREPAFHPVVKLALSRADAVTAPSAFLAEEARAVFGLDRVQVIPNFVDTEHFQPGVKTKTRVLTHNSNFRSLKRVVDVVRIFARVRERFPCELQLIGDGPERYPVEALVSAEGLRGNVRFFGETRDIVPLLQRSDVFLMPSEVESFGLAALEAMSCGVPVVASNVGGIPEVVVDGETGFLHPVGDVQSMANSTLRMLEDDVLHARMSSSARSISLERWQLAPVVDAWEALYRGLLS